MEYKVWLDKKRLSS